MSNVRELPTEPDKLKASIEKLRRNWDAMIEAETLYMKLRKARYEAAIEQGFTKEQALELCKQVI